MLFKFIGTGTSVGVPQIGCNCKTCTSTDPRDRRRRCGAYVVTDSVHPYLGRKISFLIDTPPEMREAAIEYGINAVDAVLLTHAHMDHVAGFDDIRRFNTLNGGAPLRCYAMPETVEAMRHIFPYIGSERHELGLFRPMVHFVDDCDRFTVGDLEIERVSVEHSFPCCGYILAGRLGYISDCHHLGEETVRRLAGIDTMVLNCLRLRPHPTHLNLELALGFIERIRPRRTYLIHMCHDLSHAQWTELLPEGVEAAYDGMEITI